MYQKIQYAWYILRGVLDRVTPLRPSYFAQNTLNRFNGAYSGALEYTFDKNLPRSKSVLWRLVASVAAEEKYRRRCATRLQRGFIGIWIKTTFRMAALSVTAVALSEPLVWTFQQLFNHSQ